MSCIAIQKNGTKCSNKIHNKLTYCCGIHSSYEKTFIQNNNEKHRLRNIKVMTGLKPIQNHGISFENVNRKGLNVILYKTSGYSHNNYCECVEHDEEYDLEPYYYIDEVHGAINKSLPNSKDSEPNLEVFGIIQEICSCKMKVYADPICLDKGDDKKYNRYKIIYRRMENNEPIYLTKHISVPMKFTTYQLKNTDAIKYFSLQNLEILRRREKGIVTLTRDIKNDEYFNSIKDYSIYSFTSLDDFSELLSLLLVFHKSLKNNLLLERRALMIIRSFL
jgi:hypothetical protein